METREHNVNVTKYRAGSALPCLLCSEKLRLRIAKTGKPYFVCDSCGIQLFIRRTPGMERLRKLLDRLESQQELMDSFSQEFLYFQACLTEIEKLKAQLKTANDKLPLLFADDEDIDIRDAIKKRMENKIRELQRFASGKR